MSTEKQQVDFIEWNPVANEKIKQKDKKKVVKSELAFEIIPMKYFFMATLQGLR